MKKLIIALLVLGMLAVGVQVSNADSTRTINHSYMAVTSGTTSPNTIDGNFETVSMTIYRITGYATGSNSTFGIYNTTTEETMTNAKVAIEGGEATSGDPLPVYDFGDSGLRIPAGTVIRCVNCTIVIEYL